MGQWGDGGVWVAGESDRRARKSPGESGFTSLTTGCSGNWFSMWVDGRSGRAYLGGAADKLGIQEPDSSSCTANPPTAPGSSTSGLWGFAVDGGVDLHGAGLNGDDGRTFRWNGQVGTQSVQSHNFVPFFDVHGLSPAQLFAVGGPSTSPRIYRFVPSTGVWQDEQVLTSGLNGLNAVWVVHPKLAYAVGNDRSVMQWDGQSWSKHPVTLDQADSSEDLSGVLAFGSNSVYVISLSGNIFRFNGQQWQKLHTVSGAGFHDISGTAPDDVWVVGSGGRILHWPQ